MFSTNIDNQLSFLVTVQTGRNTYVPVRHLNQTSITSTIAVEVYSWSSTTNVSMTVRASTSGKALMSMRNDWKSDFRTRDLKFDDTTMSLVQEWQNLCMKVSKRINCSHLLIWTTFVFFLNSYFTFKYCLIFDTWPRCSKYLIMWLHCYVEPDIEASSYIVTWY